MYLTSSSMLHSDAGLNNFITCQKKSYLLQHIHIIYKSWLTGKTSVITDTGTLLKNRFTVFRMKNCEKKWKNTKKKVHRSLKIKKHCLNLKLNLGLFWHIHLIKWSPITQTYCTVVISAFWTHCFSHLQCAPDLTGCMLKMVESRWKGSR